MKVLLVNGSPRQDGCTHAALKEAAGALNREGIDTEFFWIGSKPVGGCTACSSCRTLRKCVFNDAVNECRLKCLEADGFLFGTPVHFAAASGSMTGFMDRLFYSELLGTGNAAFRMKPAAAVITARRAGATAAFDQMIKYFTLMEMPVVSSRYWNMVHGAQPEETAQDLEGLATMRVLGRNMAYLLKCLEAGAKSGVPLPEKEERVLTNFIR